VGAQRNEDVTRSRAMIESYLLCYGVNWREVSAMRPFLAGGPPWLLRLTREGFSQRRASICSSYVCDCEPIVYARTMENRRNLVLSFDEIRTSFQARVVLDVLAKERSANSCLLDKWLAAIGLSASRQAISDLLDRLEKEGLVRLETVDDFQVVHLRRLGGDVASGREIRDWIARPELPE